jgi:hypothetical protein
VADLGCRDGEFALFLESLGCRVTALDQLATNRNGMAGIRALATGIASPITISETQWDTLEPSPAPCGLAAAIGLLNEVRNPMHLLDIIAASADYCFLSARVARRAPDGTPLEHLPVGYLLDAGESRADTGHWVFSETGLRRLVDRCGWEECAWINSGDQTASEPIKPERAELVYCILRRRDIFTNGRLTDGWYPAEGPRDGWRWTRDLFKIEFATPNRGMARLRFYVPDYRFEATGTFAISALVNGEVLARLPVDRPGKFVFDVPILEPAGARTEVAFWVSPAAAATGDQRVLGVIAERLMFYPKR